ncbi:zinc-finger of the MIZ type in Nse subunit-domain-containing protein [Syncephalis plumigaleata]|nr:zinc-finger of the MIZ type in Nse subunit-domain-containing protein [Syncephalis plumigaleata]
MSHSIASRLTALAKQYDSLARSIQEQQSNFVECACDLEEINAENELVMMDGTFRDVLKEEETLRVNASILESMANNTGEESMQPNMEHYHQMCKEKQEGLSTRYGSRYTRHASYKEYLQKLWEVKHPGEEMPLSFKGKYSGNIKEEAIDDEDDEDDIVQISQRVSLICPLTTMLMEDPVTSISCKHSFSRNAILDYVQQYHNTRSIPCPVAGCQQEITESTLKRNRWLETKIEHEKERMQSEERLASEYTDVI